MSGQSAVNARTTLSAMFNWAIGEGYDLAANPVTGTNRPQGAKGRDRVLTADELRAVYRACGDDDFGRVVRLLILTGQRRKEVGEMTEEEIVGDVWTIPAERAKNHNANDVPLTLLALNVIGKRKPSGRLWRVGSWSRAKAALDAKLTGIAPWTLHDLRRTFATGCADLGVLPHVVEAAINHVSGHKAGVAGIYNRARYAPEVKAALTLWADHVQALVARK
jgi:integrase